MNIDERLAAITMNLELLSKDREDDKHRIGALLASVCKFGIGLNELSLKINTLVDVVSKLADVANNHELCIQDLESN